LYDNAERFYGLKPLG